MPKPAFVFCCVLTASLVRGTPVDPATTSILRSPLVTLDDAMEGNPNAKVAVGMSRGIVLQQLGEPSLQFTRDIWVFSDFRAARLPSAASCDALVVIFTRDQVSQLRLTAAKSIRAMVARQKEAAARSGVVASR